ncbi:MAG: YlxR family protein [Actinomycetota bacterium]|nr:YlxR family protein [Actinomycetota bacterium]
MQGQGPIRTCVGCRDRASAVILLRVVAVAGVLTPDPRRCLPGRGAWLHPRVGCLDAAERRRAFGRALRLSHSLETTEVRAFLPRTSPDQDAVRSDRGRVERFPPSTPPKAGRPVVSTP